MDCLVFHSIKQKCISYAESQAVIILHLDPLVCLNPLMAKFSDAHHSGTENDFIEITTSYNPWKPYIKLLTMA